MLTGEKFYVELATGETWCDGCVPGFVACELNQAYGNDGMRLAYAIVRDGDLGLGAGRDDSGRFARRRHVAACCHTCGATQPRRGR